MNITIHEALQQVQSKFEDGHQFVELSTRDARKLHRNLYRFARARKLSWRFATTPNSVFVARRSK